MVVQKHENSHTDSKYIFYRKSGRNIIERCPVFSPDGVSIALIVENIVRVYNIETGDCARTLSTERVVNELVAIEFPEDEQYNLYGCSDTGIVTSWTWDKGAVLREINLKLPPNLKVITFNIIDKNECFIIGAGPTYKWLYLGTFSLKTGELLHHYVECRPWYYDIVRVSLGWCNGDRYAAVTNGTKVLFIQNLYKPHIKSEIINHSNLRILAVAAHHTESTVAITDTLGVTTVIRGNLFDYKSIAKEMMHWHSLPPLAICFSTQGSYLLTGGMEKVLVKWTIGNLANRANEKAFIPRLPGMIRYIATNNTHIAITLTNNSVVIASAQMRVVSTILECGGLSPAARAIGTSLVYHKQLGSLLMSGRTGHLQLYSTTTDKVLYNIDITEMNNIPSIRQNLLPLETEVTCAAISGNGSWLVTSEYRNDGINYPEERLKFWHLQLRSAIPFKLNTCVNLSHGGCNIVSLAMNNKGDFCVSAGTDQKFRIWKRETQNSKKISWNCLTACYYSSGIAQFLSHGILNCYKNGDFDTGNSKELSYMKAINPRDDIVKRLFNVHKEHNLVDESSMNVGMRKGEAFHMGDVAISQDGSLIAAWFGSRLTLWDTHVCNLRTTLSHPALRPVGVHVKFGHDDAAHYLVCTTENCVAVWSLLSLTVKWLVQLNAVCLAADPFSNRMALVTSSNDVYVFTPHSSTPILTRKRLLDPNMGAIQQCTFGAAANDDIRLYFIRNDSETYCLEPEQTEQGRLEVMSSSNLPATNFSVLLAEQQLSEVQTPTPANLQPLDTDRLRNTALSQFLSAAPHMIPPISLLCTGFLHHISGQEQSEQSEEEVENPMEVDDTSSDDEGTKHADANTSVNGHHAVKPTELWTPNFDLVKEKRLKKIMHDVGLDLHTTLSVFSM